ncbi:MAG: hypothetical protein H0X54_10760 [Propionibacteriales bacterium]|nr:hypothetical protein [Propionibacteriales bacterium]
MNLDELIRSSVRDVADHAPFSAPDMAAIERRSRRTRHVQAASAAAAVVALAVVGGLLGQSFLGRTHPSPADPHPSPGVNQTDIVWSDGRALHFADEKVPAEGRVFGIGRVDSGLVYTTDAQDAQVYFQDSAGSAAELIGRHAVLAPSGDPMSGIASWVEQDGSLTELVVYNTQTSREVGRVPVPRVLGPNDNILIPGFGPILAITGGEVFFSGKRNEVWVYSWETEAPAAPTGYRGARWLDTAGDVTATRSSAGVVSFLHADGSSVATRRFEQGLLSPDGRAFVATTLPTETSPGEVFVVDTATGRAQPLTTGQGSAPMFPPVFTSDETLLLKVETYDMSTPDGLPAKVIACDASAQACETVASLKDGFLATLPSR